MAAAARRGVCTMRAAAPFTRGRAADEPHARHQSMTSYRSRVATSATLFCYLLLGACAAPPDAKVEVPAVLPERWQAPLPHGGDTVALADWWRRFDDPLLAALIDEAERGHPSLEQARARIVQARAALRGARAAGVPAVDGNANIARQRSEFPPPPQTVTTASLSADAQWELDLFGGVRAGVAAARSRAEGSELSWHDARVSLAAETAASYVGLRACEALVAVYAEDLASRSKTAELTRAKVDAGFEAPANGALADASSAEAAGRLVAQQAECDVAVKALVALTSLPEPALRGRLAASPAKLPRPMAFVVPSLPAEWLSQRPDLAAAQRQLAAAASDIGVADADRYPRISLGGSIGIVGFRAGGFEGDGPTWSLGPLLTVPLFDGGRRAANVDAARARFDEARAVYEESARAAVREVEEALVRLDSAARREADAERAAAGFRSFFTAAQSRWEIGAGSLIDQEEARRTALAARAALVGVQRDRVAAWVQLYRAVGGGWEPAQTIDISQAKPR